MSIDRTSPLKPVSTVQPRETTDAAGNEHPGGKNNSIHQHQCDVKRRASKTDATRQQ
ncbi:negative regulator of flagellin synthesis (anti-sigma factor) [Escherichia coli]|nr:negative regulator of flagellin synthesis (anti-sigma factor) [Escherichia coli]